MAYEGPEMGRMKHVCWTGALRGGMGKPGESKRGSRKNFSESRVYFSPGWVFRGLFPILFPWFFFCSRNRESHQNKRRMICSFLTVHICSLLLFTGQCNSRSHLCHVDLRLWIHKLILFPKFNKFCRKRVLLNRVPFLLLLLTKSLLSCWWNLLLRDDFYFIQLYPIHFLLSISSFCLVSFPTGIVRIPVKTSLQSLKYRGARFPIFSHCQKFLQRLVEWVKSSKFPRKRERRNNLELLSCQSWTFDRTFSSKPTLILEGLKFRKQKFQQFCDILFLSLHRSIIFFLSLPFVFSVNLKILRKWEP